MKRFMYLIHHWLGIGICLVMAMWFFSGVVMMYVQYPTLTAQERLTALPTLNPANIRYGMDEIIAQHELSAIAQIKLSSITERPSYIVQTTDRQTHIFFADNAEKLSKPSIDDLLISANRYAKQHNLPQEKPASYKKTVDKDQWTIAGYVNSQRPFYLIQLNDKAGTELYYSSKTGELIRDTNSKERLWNWLGANLHWIYPTIIRQYGKFWYWLIVVLSVTGLISILTGAIIGYWRLRLKKRYKGNKTTPYQGQLKLHHILGLFFLIPITTFTYSGLMSMGSFGVPKDQVSYSDQLKAYQGASPSKFAEQHHRLNTLKENLKAHPDTREIVWYWQGGQLQHYVLNQHNQRLALDGKTQAQRQQEALSLLKNLLPNHQIAFVEQLNSYDKYYYAHHQRKPVLPVLRIAFDDHDQSWFYIHLDTGELINRQTKNSRTMRWLYHGLHSLDFPWLIQNRPWWDITVIALSLLGFIFSVSSVVIAYRYLRSPQKRKIKFFNKKRRPNRSIGVCQ